MPNVSLKKAIEGVMNKAYKEKLGNEFDSYNQERARGLFVLNIAYASWGELTIQLTAHGTLAWFGILEGCLWR